jgi:hydrogenase nickel incorporation protein HypA/HybF
MHELAITQSILEIAGRHAQGARITNIHLVIGQLSSIIDDSVQFYWDMISEGTLAEGSQLHFKRVPAEMSCRECGHNYQPADYLVCPNCDSTNVRVISGTEFYLDSIEVTQEEEENIPV